MKNVVAIYARLSREDEDKIDGSKDSRSIENQISILSEFALKNDMEIYKVYYDDGISGSTINRPGFNNLLKDMELKRFNTILVKDLSRLGRNLHQVGSLIDDLFPKKQVRCIALNDNYDSLTYDGEESITLRIFLNSYYLKDFKKKINRSIKYRANHKHMITNPKYGYVKKDGTAVIEPYSAGIVKRIFEMALNKMSTSDIAKVLNDEGVLTRAVYYKNVLKLPSNHTSLAEKWTSAFIREILKDCEYCGHSINCSHSKNMDPIIIKNTHEAIIDEALFNEVQDIIKVRPKVVMEKPDNINNLLRHEATGKYFRLMYKDRRIPKYSCRGEGINIDINELHSIIYEDIKDVILKGEKYLEKIKSRILKDIGDVDELNKILKDLNLEYSKLLEKYFSNLVSESVFKNKSELLSKKINDTENKLKKTLTLDSKIEILTNKFNSFIKNTILDDSDKINIIKQVVSKVKISKVNNNIKLKIRYKFEG